MKAGNLILSIMVTLLIGGVAHAGNRVPDLRLLEVQDGYEISYGPMIEAYQGQENVLIPLYISNEEAIEYIHLNLSYDASVIEPTLMAPSLFYQYFHYDLSIQGLISIDIECDLPTPPVVPPIPPGDTIFAYILCDVVVDDLDQDVFGELGYFEDPNTPFPDNFLMRDNGYFIVAPQLLLTGGMIDVFSPVYGDINLNSLPYEIGDVITFISFLSGQIEFSPRQMANSDCNQDGIPATIADLVYMLNVINGESEQLATGQPVIPDILELGTVLQNLLPKPIKSLDKSNILHLNIIANKPLGGFVIALNAPDNVSRINEVTLGGQSSEGLFVSSGFDEAIRIVGFAIGRIGDFGSEVQVDISIDATGIMSQSDFAIRFADFSDIDGVQIEAKCTFELEKIAGRQENQSTGNSGVDFKAFPNPFNSRVIISFAMNQPGPVTAEIFDILGRRVRVLADGFEQAGSVVLKWDGTNDSGHQAAAGIYFCKIRIDSQERVVKVQYLK